MGGSHGPAGMRRAGRGIRRRGCPPPARAGGAAGWTQGFYERHDAGARLAAEARRRFLAATVERGEAGMDLAEAALAVAAEDDALVTGSVVPLPVEAYLQRLEKMVDELASKRLAHLDAAAAAPRDVLDVVDAYLFGEKRFRVPVSGRSKLERGLVIVNPGCYEDAAHAYLHQVLQRRVGCPAAIAIVYGQVLKKLLERGVVDFAVRMDCSDPDARPAPVVLEGLGRAALVRDGVATNTVTSEVLREVLRLLKRAYWPFAWDTRGRDAGTGGGFMAAAAALTTRRAAATAGEEAIARTAKHRLSRGIWTSTGAGDLVRAKAAVERLALLCGATDPVEYRDAAVILCHCGEPDVAKVLLDEYVESPHFARSAEPEREQVRDLLAVLPPDAGAADGRAAGELLAGVRAQERTGLDIPW